MSYVNVNLANGVTFSMHQCYRFHVSLASQSSPPEQLKSMRDVKYVELVLDKSILTSSITDSHFTHLHVYPASSIPDFYGFSGITLSLFSNALKEVALTTDDFTSIIKCSTLTMYPGLVITKVEIGYAMQFSERKNSDALSFKLPIDQFNPEFICFWNSDSIKLDIDAPLGNNIMFGGEITASKPDPLESKWDGTSCYMNSLMPANCGKCRNYYCTVWGI